MEFLIILLLLALIIYLILRIRSLKKQLKTGHDGFEEYKNKMESLKKYEVISDLEDETEKLREKYKEKKLIYDELRKEAAIFNETIELSQLGFYAPHFDFDTSEKYKDKIKQIKAKQREMISKKTAITCDSDWAVEGSKAKGKTFTNRGIRMTARAFNNECDAAISKVNWNNANRIEKRIEKAYDAINKLNESMTIRVSYNYLDLKLEELYLQHEYKEKKQEEKEEQAEIRRQIREETQLERDSIKAFKEEEKYQRLLDKAKKEAEQASGEKLEKLKGQIENLSVELEAAQIKNERAKSMAQQTKIGHVYVISNHGSFGEGIYKIGMTRRLEPLDRVKELGDASVPFLFDLHAMIYSENAPALEKQLHKVFEYNRLNLVNGRKEFFKVSLDRIIEEVKSFGIDVEFIETAEARQYKESKAILEHRKSSIKVESQFPEAI